VCPRLQSTAGLRCVLEHLPHLGQHVGGLVHEPHVALAVLDAGEARPPVGLEGREPEDLAVRIHERDPDRLRADAVIEAEPAEHLDAVLEPTVGHHLVERSAERGRRRSPSGSSGP